MRYFIPAGSAVYRSTEKYASVVYHDRGSWEALFTAKPVTYDEDDLHTEVEKGDEFYLFRLPTACTPYTWLMVYRPYVDVVFP